MKRANNCIPKHLIILLFSLLLLIFMPLSVQAEQPPAEAASVVAVRGTVVAINETGKTRKLAIKSPVFAKDTIHTGKRGRIQILFSDNTIYSLGQKSELKIDQYNWHPEQKTGTLKTTIKEGVFRVMGGAITKVSPKNFSTETPVATIGIRGSMYAGTVTSTNTSIVFNGGKGIHVSNPMGTVNISRPGHGTHVKVNSAPEPPTKFSVEEVAKLNKALAAQTEETEQQEPDSQETPPNESEDESTENQPDTVQDSDTQQITDSIDTPDVEIPPANETAPIIDPNDPPPTEPPPTEPPPTEPPPTEPPPTEPPPTEPPPTEPPPTEPPPTEPPPTEPPPTEPPPGSLPTDGLTNYSGTGAGTSVNIDGTVSPINEIVWLEINWHTSKALGRISGTPPVFFIADVSGNTITNISVYGSNLNNIGNPPPVTAFSGTGSGIISGTSNDFFSVDAFGSSFDILPANQPLYETWSLSISGTQGPQDPGDVTVPTGSATWKGAVVGISENMLNIDTERRLFMSEDLGDFFFTLDKDQGTVSGQLSAVNAEATNAALSGITIGGTSPSVFVLEDNFAAALACTTGNCISTNGASGTLKTYGNFLISDSPTEAASEIAQYATWGYWEIAYTDPSNNGQYHTHVPGSKWIAGQPTPIADVTNLVSSNFIGNYSGTAFASKIDKNVPPGSPQVTELKGTFSMNVDFGNIAAASAVTGSINLPGESSFSLNSGPAGNASTSGFTHGTIDGAAKSNVTGFFYGPDATSIGGNFYADFSSGKSFLGIYGGDR